MSTNLVIAIRFLLSRQKSMLMSLAGITLGVAFFILTQAQTSGFETFFIRTILGTNGAIRVREQIQDTLRSMELASESEAPHQSFQISHQEGKRYIGEVAQPEEISQAIREFANVKAISQVLTGNAQMQIRGQELPAQIYGIELDAHTAVSDLQNQIQLGNLDDFRKSPGNLLLSTYLAERYDLEPGDKVVVETSNTTRKMSIAAIYETGVRDIDKVRLFVHLRTARSLMNKPFGVTFLQVGLHDHERAELDAQQIQEVTRHHASPWQKREKVWLDVFRLLRISSALTVSILLLISGLGMFSVLAIIVMEKTREIAILRSMGYQRSDISRIFLWQGFLVTTAGTIMGWILGFTLTFSLTKLPIRIRGIFSTDHIVVHWSIFHYLLAAAIAYSLVMLASYIPSRRAALLEPADIIRGTSG
jgi:lipoprotein-releasing system permease protein